MLRNTSGAFERVRPNGDTASKVIQRIIQLYGAIHAPRIVTPWPRHHTAIQRHTTLYAHTAIHRYTLYSPMQHPSL